MYEQQQPWGQPQQPGHPPQGAGGSAIALTLKYHPLAFLMGFIKPQVQINGHRSRPAGRPARCCPCSRASTTCTCTCRT